jgi:thiol-disulfide isomerase/thioredoxin
LIKIFKDNKRTLIYILFTFIIIASFYQKIGINKKGLSVGREAAPSFTLSDPEGKEISLSDFKGKPVVLNFWATWCPPCIAEMPALNTISDSYKDSGVIVIGINSGESVETVKSFVGKFGISFPVLLDGDQKINDKYKIFGLPTTFFIDKNGVIVDQIVGGAEEEIFNSKIKMIL